ncbi:MAG TPA: hypothetical protein VFT53_06910 [Candidatus Saccharimonadales bacterium]|nr:hypothetical protein [Candidatus Saccharimonadales bacterium]
MNSLYNELSAAGRQRRQEIAGEVIGGLLIGATVQNARYEALCQDIINRRGLKKEIGTKAMKMGQFGPTASAELLQDTARVIGFLEALQSTMAQQSGSSVIDAGTGSSALFPVAAAVFDHQTKKIIGIERNPSAAQCAQEVVELFGFADRIDIRQGDILSSKVQRSLPMARIGITETFSIGLLMEQGHKIVETLSHATETVIPTHAILYGAYGHDPYYNAWDTAADLDLRQPHTHARGRISGFGHGRRDKLPVRVYAAYYGEQYEPIVTDANIDTITQVLHLGEIGAPQGRIDVCFEYKLGDNLPRNNVAYAKLWLEQAAD